MRFPILTGVQNGRIRLRKKTVIVSYKMFFLRLCFRDEGRLYIYFLFEFVTIYPKCHLFQFLSCC